MQKQNKNNEPVSRKNLQHVEDKSIEFLETLQNQNYANNLNTHESNINNTPTRNKLEKFNRSEFVKFDNVTNSSNAPQQQLKSSIDFLIMNNNNNKSNNNNSKPLEEKHDVNISQNMHDKLIKLSNMVINFVAEMSKLQDSIAKKLPNKQDLKKEFEFNKFELINYAKSLLGTKMLPQGGKKSDSKSDSTVKTPVIKENKTICSTKSQSRGNPVKLPQQVDIKDNLVNTFGNGQEVVNINFKDNSENEKLINSFEKLKREKITVDAMCDNLLKDKKELLTSLKVINEKLKKVDDLNKSEFGELGKDFSTEEGIEFLIKKLDKYKMQEESYTQDIINLKVSINEYKTKNGLFDQEFKSLKLENQRLKSKELQNNKLIVGKDQDIECK